MTDKEKTLLALCVAIIIYGSELLLGFALGWLVIAVIFGVQLLLCGCYFVVVKTVK